MDMNLRLPLPCYRKFSLTKRDDLSTLGSSYLIEKRGERTPLFREFAC